MVSSSSIFLAIRKYGSVLAREVELLRKDGRIIWVSISARVVRDKAGNPIFLEGFLVDISDRKRAEATLAEAGNYLAKIITSAADPIFVKDRQHRWVLANDAFCSFMGRSREEILGKSDYDFLPSEQVDVLWTNDEKVFTSAAKRTNEDTFVDANGVVHSIITKKTPYTDEKKEQFIVGIISDTGVGMDAQVIEHIFEPFYTTKELGKGTGLGLSTVYGIVKQHGGSISVYSAKNHGSIFKVFLPSVYGEGEGKEGRRPSPDEVSRGSETILVVEDDEMVRFIACSMLENLGYQVLSAENPDKSIDLVKQHEGVINLLLTDVVMPRMNDKDLYELLHRMQPDMKVIFMSGYTSDVIGHHGVLDQGTHFIQKPFSLQKLSEKVRLVLAS